MAHVLIGAPLQHIHHAPLEEPSLPRIRLLDKPVHYARGVMHGAEALNAAADRAAPADLAARDQLRRVPEVAVEQVHLVAAELLDARAADRGLGCGEDLDLRAVDEPDAALGHAPLDLGREPG